MELEKKITGTTYSVSDYQKFTETGDNNYFEEIIDKMILEALEIITL